MSESEDTSYPMLNLIDRNPAHIWKGGVADSQTLEIDLGSARAVDTIVLGNHNLLTALGYGSITVESKLNAGDSWITWKSVPSLAGAVTDGDTDLEAPSASMRYWRITLVGAGVAIAPQIGNISLGARIEMSEPHDSGDENGEVFATIARRAVDGSYYASQPYGGIENWKWSWSDISDDERDKLLALDNVARGMLEPFYIIDASGSIVLALLAAEMPNPSSKSYNHNDIRDIEFEAFLTDTLEAEI